MRATEIMSGIWSMPIERRGKSANHVHELPLPKLAIEILQSLPRSGDLLFSTNGKTHISGYSKRSQLDAR